MRINVYNEEITDKVQLVEKEANGVPFYGIQFRLQNLNVKTPVDAEKPPSVTFWVSDNYTKGLLTKVLTEALEKVTNLQLHQ